MKFDENFVQARLEQHARFLERRDNLLAKLMELAYEAQENREVKETQKRPFRRMTALARKVLANASKPLNREVSRDAKGRITGGLKVRGAAA